MTSQLTLFYDDAHDALEKSIAVSGASKKEIAALVYPGRKLETAQALLSRALSPENSDVSLSIEIILTIMRNTRPEDFIYYLCDEFRFNRPSHKTEQAIEEDIRVKMQAIQEQMGALMKSVKSLGGVKK